MYFQNLSGIIPTNKQVEFEQTFRLVISQMPDGCKTSYIAKDVIHDGVYYITFQWEDLHALKSFTHSPIFTILVGAFNTLGKLYENNGGEIHLN
jgi:hypothetical protein